MHDMMSVHEQNMFVFKACQDMCGGCFQKARSGQGWIQGPEQGPWTHKKNDNEHQKKLSNKNRNSRNYRKTCKNITF